jgi:hypothetical protein
MDIKFLINPLISGGICSVIILILFYIDSKIIKKQKEKKEYIKIFLFVFITVSLLIYIMKIHNLFVEDISIINKTPKIQTKVLDTGMADF